MAAPRAPEEPLASPTLFVLALLLVAAVLLLLVTTYVFDPVVEAGSERPVVGVLAALASAVATEQARAYRAAGSDSARRCGAAELAAAAHREARDSARAARRAARAARTCAGGPILRAPDSLRAQ